MILTLISLSKTYPAATTFHAYLREGPCANPAPQGKQHSTQRGPSRCRALCCIVHLRWGGDLNNTSAQQVARKVVSAHGRLYPGAKPGATALTSCHTRQGRRCRAGKVVSAQGRLYPHLNGDLNSNNSQQVVHNIVSTQGRLYPGTKPGVIALSPGHSRQEQRPHPHRRCAGDHQTVCGLWQQRSPP